METVGQTSRSLQLPPQVILQPFVTKETATFPQNTRFQIVVRTCDVAEGCTSLLTLSLFVQDLRTSLPSLHSLLLALRSINRSPVGFRNAPHYTTIDQDMFETITFPGM